MSSFSFFIDSFSRYSVFYGVIILFLLSFRHSKDRLEPLGIDISNELKGVAISIVLIGHLAILVGIINLPTTEYFAAHGVDIFLFLSAFGLMTSFMRNGIKGFWKKRMLVLIVPYILFNIIRIPINAVVEGNITISQFFLSLFALDVSFDGTMWYIQYIIIWYIIFYIIASVKNIDKNTVVIGIVIASLIMFITTLVLLSGENIPKNPLLESYSHHLGFPLGAIFFLLYDKIKKLPALIHFILSAIMLLLYTKTVSGIPETIQYTVANLSFVLFLVFLFIGTAILGLKSKVLQKLGEISYQIYLNELFVIVLVVNWLGLKGNLAAILILILTVVVGILLKYLSDFVVNSIKKTSN